MTDAIILSKTDTGAITLRYHLGSKVFYWEFASVTELLQLLHDLARLSEGDTRQLRPACVAFIVKFPRRSLQDTLNLCRNIGGFVRNNYPEYAWSDQLREDVYMAVKGAENGRDQ